MISTLSRLLGYSNAFDLASSVFNRARTPYSPEEKAVLNEFRAIRAYSDYKVPERVIVGILPEVKRGDFRSLMTHKPPLMHWSNWLRRWAPLVATPSVVDANFQLCAPLLRAACDGARVGPNNALMEFTHHRLICGPTLPDWTKPHLTEEHLSLSEALRKNRRELRDVPFEAQRELFLCASPIAFFPRTFVQAGVHEEHALEFESKLYDRLEREEVTKSIIARVDFTMAEADRVLENHGTLVERLIQLRFFADFAEVYQIPDPQKHLDVFLKQKEKLDTIIAGQRFQRMVNAARVVDEYPDGKSVFGTLVISKNPRGIAERLQAAAKVTDKVDLTEDETQTVKPEGTYTSINSSADLLLGIKQCLQSFRPQETEIANISRQLYALTRRGLISYQEVIGGLSNGRSPIELITSGRARSNSKIDVTKSPPLQSQPTELPSPAPDERSERAVFFASTRVLREFEKIEGSTLKLTKQRLARLALGEVLEHSVLDGDLKQLKIHHGGGLRIFFDELPNGSFLILGIADKASQQNEINKLRKQDRKALGTVVRYL